MNRHQLKDYLPTNKDTLVLFADSQTNTVPDTISDTISFSQKIKPEESIFFTELGNRSIKIQKREIEHNNWLSLILLVCIVVYILTQYFNFNKVRQIYMAFLAKHHSDHLNRESNLLTETVSLPLQLVSLFSMASFLFLVFRFYNTEELIKDGFVSFIFLLLGILGLWFLKLLVIRWSGFIFKTENSAKEYNANMLVFLIINGLVLLPVSVLSLFVDERNCLYLGFALSSVIYFMWILRGISIGRSEYNFSALHLFLYLCTVEFLPLLVLLKLIQKA
jgi:Domain of unknown function (DUF4271)